MPSTDTAGPAPAVPLSRWRCVRTLRGGHSGSPLQVVRFSSDGRYCITGGNDRAAVLWNPHKDGLPSDALAAGGGVGAGAGAGAGAIASGAGPSSSSPSASVVQRYAGQHGGEVVDVAITRDGSRFATAGGGDRCAVVWDVTTGKVIRKLFGHDARLHCLAWNEWAGGGGAEGGASSGGGGDATVLFTGGEDKIVRAWDLRSPHTNREPAQAFREAKDAITRVSVESAGGGGGGGGGGAPSSAAPRVVSASMDGCVRTYDLRFARLTTDFVGPPISTAFVAHSGGAYLASSFSPGVGGALLLVDRSTGAVLNRYSGHANTAFRLGCCMTADDAYVASGSEDGRLCVWDTLSFADQPPQGWVGGAAAAAPYASSSSSSSSYLGGIQAHSRAVSWVEPHPLPPSSVGRAGGGAGASGVGGRGVASGGAGAGAGTGGGGGRPRMLLTASFDGTAKLWAEDG